MNMLHMVFRTSAHLLAAAAICVVGVVSPVFAGLSLNQLADAPAWPGTPALSTTGSLNLQTDFNVEVTIRPQNCESTATTCNGAAVHTFVPATTFQLDKFMIRLAGAPSSGELYIYPEPVGGTDIDGFTDVSFSTSLINGGVGLPFNFAGNPSRMLAEFDLTGTDEIFLSAGTKYAIEIRNVSSGTTACDGSSPCMYWLRAGNASHLNDYIPGSVYATNNNTNPGQRFDVGGGRRDGTLALYAPAAAVLGDYNNNGVVDAGDYVAWRKGGTLQNEVADPNTVSPADYTEWRARFGNTSGAAAGLEVGAVPEPAGLMLAITAMALFTLRRGTKEQCG